MRTKKRENCRSKTTRTKTAKQNCNRTDVPTFAKLFGLKIKKRFLILADSNT